MENLTLRVKSMDNYSKIRPTVLTRILHSRISFSFLILLILEYSYAVSASGPPRVVAPSNGNSQPIAVVKGESRVRLQCPIESNPAAVLTVWKKDGETIHAGWNRFRIKDSGTLIISNVEPDDTGLYRCQATNGFGSAEYYVAVYVKDTDKSPVPPDILQDLLNKENLQRKPFDEKEVIWVDGKDPVGGQQDPSGAGVPPGGASRPVFLPPGLKNRTALVGDKVVFECLVSSEMEPVIQWLKRVESEEDLRYSNMTLYVDNILYVLIVHRAQALPRGNGAYLSTLTLPRVQGRDSGMYYCTATNLNGISHISAYLKVTSLYATNTGEPGNYNNITPSSTHLLPVVIAIISIATLIVVTSLILYYTMRCRRGQSIETGVVNTANQDNTKSPIGGNCSGGFFTANQGACSPTESDEHSQYDLEHCHMLRPQFNIHQSGRPNPEGMGDICPGVALLDCSQGQYDTLDTPSDVTNFDEPMNLYKMRQLQLYQQQQQLLTQQQLQLQQRMQHNLPYRSPYVYSYDHVN